jgi:hypothetical protein
MPALSEVEGTPSSQRRLIVISTLEAVSELLAGSCEQWAADCSLLTAYCLGALRAFARDTHYPIRIIFPPRRQARKGKSLFPEP